MVDRTTLAKSDRKGKETFYLLTMDASLSNIVRLGDEMTEGESRTLFAERGMPENEISALIEDARRTYTAQHEKN
jgi:hypothetical protein